MIRLPAKRKATPIGLDLGTYSFKAVQLQPVAGRTREAIALSIPRTKPGTAIGPEEILRLQGALERRGFIGRDVVLAVPPDALSTSILELPARAPGLPIEQLAAAEFSRVSKLDAAAISLSCWDLPASVRTTRATYMMAVGAPTPRLDELIDLTEVGAMSVVAIDDPFSAIARGAIFGGDGAGGLRTVIDIGFEAVRLSLVHGRALAYTRKFPEAGLAKLMQAAVDATGDDAVELQHQFQQQGLRTSADHDAGLGELIRGHFNPLLKEIGQTLGYAQHQYPDTPANGLILCGGGAMLPGIADYVAATLQASVSLGGQTSASADVVLALGLCLWEDKA